MYRRYPQLPPRRDATRLGCLLEEDCACPFFLPFFLFFRGLPNLKGLKRFPWGWRIAADRLPTEPLLPTRFVSSRFFSVRKFLHNSFEGDSVMMTLFLSPFFMKVIIFSLLCDCLSQVSRKKRIRICRLLFEIIDGEFPSLDRSMAYLSLWKLIFVCTSFSKADKRNDRPFRRLLLRTEFLLTHALPKSRRLS